MKARDRKRSLAVAGDEARPSARVVRAVLALLLVFGCGGIGLALDRVRAETGVDRAVAALGVSGAGVIVAILDRGIDWESNDFRNDDGTTRIAYVFDMCDEAGADDVDNNYGRGTIYTRRQIDRALAAGTTLATQDAVGHGTTTTGIAAGNGRNMPDRKYRGVAPNATIIAVKIVGGVEGKEPDCWAGRSGISVGVDFVVDKARELEMPVVMLANVGSLWAGPHDGTSALSRKIDRTVGPDHPGVVFVTGTGDDGWMTPLRAAGEVPNGGTLDLRFALDEGEGSLHLRYDGREAFVVSVRTPAGMLGPYPASQRRATGPGVRVSHYGSEEDPYGTTNGTRLLSVRFDGAAGAGDYALRLEHGGSSAGSGIRFDAVLHPAPRIRTSGRFLNHAKPGGTIWDLATTFRNVAPNSYVIRTNWTDIDGRPRSLTGEGDVGELWFGSSVGPTVDGRIGVDVSAPGDRIVTTYAPRSAWGQNRWQLIEGGGGLYGMAGAVSAAAPIVTGVIALMLEVDPTLDASSVKRILRETARSDEFTGPTPNTLWGYGKVDAYEALMAVRHESVNGRTNRAPRPLGSIPPQTVAIGGGAISLPVAQYFTDPDNYVLTYTALSSGTGVVAVSVSGSTVTLTPVAAGTATVGVTARDPAGQGATQSISVTVTRFTDDPLLPGVTPVRAVHFRELRARIDVLRTVAGLSRFAWTDASLRPGVTPVRQVHLTELRTALDSAYAEVGRPSPAYSDAAVTVGTPIRARHIAELRAAVAALENAPPILAGAVVRLERTGDGIR